MRAKFVFPEKYAQTVLDSELTVVEALEVNLDENRRRRSSACALTNVTVGPRCRILLNNGFELLLLAKKISNKTKQDINLCIIC